MKQFSLIVLVLGMATHVWAAEPDPALAELDAKITHGLAQDKWDEASKTFVRTVWADFSQAYRSPSRILESHSIFSKLPDAHTYNDYVGTFAREQDASRPFLEVLQDEQGHFLVKLEGHTLPAVTTNMTLLITTGDIVYSRIPRLGAKPYCDLELYILIRTDGKFFFGSPTVPPEKWFPLSKLSEK